MPVKKSKSTKKRLPTAPDSNWPKVEQQPKHDQSDFDLEDCRIDLYAVDRQIWSGISKADLIRYYHQVAPFLLSFIQNRPQSLHVKYQGVHAPGVYIKDMEGREPDCATVFKDQRRHKAKGKNPVINYLVCNNEATLLWMINIGCIDINPWHSRITDHLHPDYIVIDLDPTEKVLTDKGLDRLITVALATKDYCDHLKLKTFVKTSGKTGLHFLVPCNGFGYPQTRHLANKICDDVYQLVPSDSTTAVSVSQRAGKVYLDPSQNDYADTIAASYCLRPYVTPTVSTPLTWKEIKRGLDPRTFTIPVILKRLATKGDLWAKLLDPAVCAHNSKRLMALFTL